MSIVSIDPRPEKLQSKKSPNRDEKGSWERVCYSAALQGGKGEVEKMEIVLQ